MADAERLLRDGHPSEALERLAPLLGRSPADWRALALAATAHRALGDRDRAAERLAQAVEQRPDHPALLSNLAALRRDLGDCRSAADLARRALALEETHLGARINLGLALEELGQGPAALEAFAEAARRHPGSGTAKRHLALARWASRRNQVSARHGLEELLESRPADPELRAEFANALLQHGDPCASVAQYECLLEDAASYPPLDGARWHSAMLLARLHAPGMDPAELLARARAWRAAYGASAAEAMTDPGPPVPLARNLRIGWLSPRFTAGPVASFLLPVLEAEAPLHVEHWLYSTRRVSGPETDRFRVCATGWRDLDPTAPETAARMIAGDRLDVLVDLAGHSPGGLLQALSSRPAPVQVTWLDSFVTTGLDVFDAFLTDRDLSPPGDERHFSEPLLRLDGGRLCYRPSREVPEPSIGRLPAAPGEGPVLASFNRLSKLNTPLLRVWARILEGLPDATLWLRNKRFDDQQVREEFLARCGRLGMDPGRLRLDGFCPYETMMADYARVDLVLDPFPFSGCTTTCDALWMGVPVVTRPGRTLVSRQSAAMLKRVGLEDCVAGSDEDYVRIALALAEDRERRLRLRGALRARLGAACRPESFAQELVAALRGLAARPDT